MPIASFYDVQANPDAFINPWTGRRDPSGSAILFHLLHQLTIADGTMALTPAPGAGKEYSKQLWLGPGGTPNNGKGNALTVTGAGVTSVRTDMDATLDIAADNDNDQGYYVHCTSDGTPPSTGTGVTSFIYTDATDATVNWYGWGDLWTTNLLSGASGASRYMTFGCTGASTDTEAEVQMPWPCAGYFQYARGAAEVQAGDSNVTVALRINGADSALTLTKSAGVGIISDTSTIVSVSAGDLVSWRITQASPNYGYFYCAMMCGFIAS